MASDESRKKIQADLAEQERLQRSIGHCNHDSKNKYMVFLKIVLVWQMPCLGSEKLAVLQCKHWMNPMINLYVFKSKNAVRNLEGNKKIRTKEREIL